MARQIKFGDGIKPPKTHTLSLLQHNSSKPQPLPPPLHLPPPQYPISASLLERGRVRGRQQICLLSHLRAAHRASLKDRFGSGPLVSPGPISAVLCNPQPTTPAHARARRPLGTLGTPACACVSAPSTVVNSSPSPAQCTAVATCALRRPRHTLHHAHSQVGVNIFKPLRRQTKPAAAP